MKTYFFYMVASRTKVLYVGFTHGLEWRAQAHKTKPFDGFTARYNVNRLVYLEEYANTPEATEREKQLKR